MFWPQLRSTALSSSTLRCTISKPKTSTNEIDAGDVPIHAQHGVADQQRLEAAAAGRIFGLLPDAQANRAAEQLESRVGVKVQRGALLCGMLCKRE